MTSVASFAGPFTQSVVDPVGKLAKNFTVVTGDEKYSYSTVYVAPLPGRIIGISGYAIRCAASCSVLAPDQSWRCAATPSLRTAVPSKLGNSAAHACSARRVAVWQHCKHAITGTIGATSIILHCHQLVCVTHLRSAQVRFHRRA